MSKCASLVLFAVAGLAPVSVSAQSFTNPADPAAAAPPVRYDSAFADFASIREQKLASWREVNDEVARVGGHIGILRGQGAGTAKTPAASATPPTIIPSQK